MAISGLLNLNSKLTAKPFSAAKFRYPGDLNPSTQPFVHFEVRDAVAKDASVLTNFILYMPPTIKTNYRGKWEDVELSFQQLTDVGGDIWNLTNIKKRLGLAIGGNLLGGLTGTNARAQQEIESGMMVNPHAALQFKGMDFREFRMEFHMMARNKKESTEIQNIIQKFRYHMHPDTESTTTVGSKFFLYPEHFNIKLYSPNDTFLFKFHDCILMDMEVDYAGSGVPSFFTENGAPVDVRMNLTFKELAVLTKKDFSEDGSEKPDEG